MVYPQIGGEGDASDDDVLERLRAFAGSVIEPEEVDRATGQLALALGRGEGGEEEHRYQAAEVRHGILAVLTGLALHGGFRPWGSTFLVFSDYLRPALRLAALMAQPVIHVFTHDSVAVGEDGPTHQPVEHLESLRLIPGVQVLRPADEAETVEAWRRAVQRTDGPTALVLSRQSVPSLALSEPIGAVDVEIVATGSEVQLAVEVAARLQERSLIARVISAMDRADFSPFHRMLDVLSRPFEDQPDARDLAEPPLPHERVAATFCGT